MAEEAGRLKAAGLQWRRGSGEEGVSRPWGLRGGEEVDGEEF